ncbi:MAG: c-type cytochrome domain-containing protein, partial [Verrucomicrobiota bacterium]
MKPLLRLALLASITGRLLAEGPDADPAARLEFFEQRIRPALVEHCHECHSATAKKIQGGLRVDSRAALLAGGDTGPAVVPGKPESSWLIRALDHSDRDLAMPPKQTQLPAAVRQDFRRWVAAGAPWPGGDTAEAP